MPITNAQIHSPKSELRFRAGSNPARGPLEIRDGEITGNKLAGKKDKRLSSDNHAEKAVHYHHHYHHHHPFKRSVNFPFLDIAFTNIKPHFSQDKRSHY